MSDNALERRTALVVLGAHRSGTSAMARVLGLSGGRLPNDSHPAGPDNERGFWESQAVIALNEEMLGACDSAWDDVFAGQPRHHLSNFDRVFRERAGETLQAIFGEGDPIVLKDPRINVLAAFWDAALRTRGYEPVYVIMVRHPVEVAASMLLRNGLPTDQGLLLWLDHMLAAERDTRNARRLFIAYDDLLEDWRPCLDRAEAVWGRSLPRRTSTAANAIEQFLAPALRHHRAGERALQGASPVRRMVLEAYGWFRDASRAAEPPDGRGLDGVRERLGYLREAVEPMFAEQRVRLAGYVKHAGALEGLRSELSTRLEATAAREAELVQQLAASKERGAALALQLDDIGAQLAQSLAEAAQSAQGAHAAEAYEAELSALREDLERHRHAVAERDDELNGLRETLELHREEIGRRGEALDQLRRDLAVLHEAGAAREQLIAELREALEQAGDRRPGTEAELEFLETRYGVLSAELVRVQSAAEEAWARNRSLADKLKAEVEGAAAAIREQAEAHAQERAQAAADARALREAHGEAMDGLRHAHERALEDLRSAHDRALEAREGRSADTERELLARLDDLRRDREAAEREIESLRSERAQILGSTSWKLVALPRRLVSSLRRR